MLTYIDRPTFNFNLQGRRLVGRGYKTPLNGSIDFRLGQIVKDNENTVECGGMMGAAEVFMYLGSTSHLKRKAAQCIAAHKANRTAQIQLFGKAKGTYWLDKAAEYRRLAGAQ